jgi:hypothetical protein
LLDIKSLEGTVIMGIFRPVNATLLKRVQLHKVEQYGIWIESQDINEVILSSRNLPSTPQTLVIFVPWSEVFLILGSADTPALSEKAFGL